GKSLLNINGMGAESVVSGVTICRPLLPVDKSLVLDFAHKYGIPYFKDTTPTWSNRGKLRNQLLPLLQVCARAFHQSAPASAPGLRQSLPPISSCLCFRSAPEPSTNQLLPLLQEIYGEGFLQNLSTLGSDAIQMTDLINQGLLQPFWDQMHRTSVATWVDCAEHLDQPVFFWREALRWVCHGMGIGMFKDKPLQELLERLRKPQAKMHDGWMTLKKENKTFVQRHTLIIFRSSFFPNKPYVDPGHPIELEKEHHFGPWRVRAARIPKGTCMGTPAEGESSPSDAADGQINGQVADGQINGQVANKLTMCDVLTGDFSYVLAVRKGDTFFVAPEAKLRQLRGLDRDIRLAIPVVVGSGEVENLKCKPTGPPPGATEQVKVNFSFVL
ncbi:hypothetical protein CYMTET_54546, partial [Cymbomonas tetramitiformis]